MQEHVFHHKRRKKGKLVPSRTFYGRYRMAGDAKPTTVNLGVTDRQVAFQKLRKIVIEREREAAGLIPPKSERDAAQKPLIEYLQGFVSNLTTRNRSLEYVYYIEKRLQKLMAACNWNFVKDVTPESFENWQGKQTTAPKTINEYLNAAITFLNWILRNRRNENPLLGVERLATRGRERRKRRVLSDAEMQRFIEVAGERAKVYTIAALTGLRRGELGQLVWGDFEDVGNACFLNVRGCTTKSKREARLPLHPVVSSLLRGMRPVDAEINAMIFLSIPSMYLYRADLAAAGIEYKDSMGRQFDFHALRHTFDTNLLRQNVSLPVAMFLMRHLDPRHTAKTYVDASRLPVADAIESLPWLGMKSTQIDTHENVIEGHGVSQLVNAEPVADMPPSLTNKGFAGDLSHNVTPCHAGEKVASLGFENSEKPCEIEAWRWLAHK